MLQLHHLHAEADLEKTCLELTVVKVSPYHCITGTVPMPCAIARDRRNNAARSLSVKRKIRKLLSTMSQQA